ncbi:hypothetical protein D3C76_901810 [compost metagenome]
MPNLPLNSHQLGPAGIWFNWARDPLLHHCVNVVPEIIFFQLTQRLGFQPIECFQSHLILPLSHNPRPPKLTLTTLSGTAAASGSWATLAAIQSPQSSHKRRSFSACSPA